MNEVEYLRVGRVAAAPFHLNLDKSVEVDAAGIDHVAGGFVNGDTLSRYAGFVHACNARDDNAVGTDYVAGSYTCDVAYLDLVYGDFDEISRFFVRAVFATAFAAVVLFVTAAFIMLAVVPVFMLMLVIMIVFVFVIMLFAAVAVRHFSFYESEFRVKRG